MDHQGKADVMEIARAWAAEGRKIALATVIETWGSAPRAAGSQLVIDEDGNFEGSVSGGCVEGAVVLEALEVIAGDKPRLLSFGVADETAWRVGLSCGGTIRIFIEKLSEKADSTLFEPLAAFRRDRRAAVLATWLTRGESRFLTEDAVLENGPLAEAARAAFAMRTARLAATEDGEVFLNPFLPPVRLIVIGAVHISQALIPIARAVDIALTIIDPRTAFATPARFGDTPLFAEWPETALPPLALGPYDALAALTHDPKIDDFALVHALARGCFYVGALGSRKTHAKRVQRLAAQGVTDAACATIRAPIGLDIGAATPGEIALAIMGEVVAALHRRLLRA